METYIQGLFETHLEVADLERSRTFYEAVLGLKLTHLEQKRRIAFYVFGNPTYMLGIWEKPQQERHRGHFAFRVSAKAILELQERLHNAGLNPRNFLEDDSGQLYVFPWLPAVSVYFEDPDGNSLEFLAMLPESPRPDLELMTWKRWQEIHAKEGVKELLWPTT
jgi:lactoylglutathione lyase